MAVSAPAGPAPTTTARLPAPQVPPLGVGASAAAAATTVGRAALAGGGAIAGWLIRDCLWPVRLPTGAPVLQASRLGGGESQRPAGLPGLLPSSRCRAMHFAPT